MANLVIADDHVVMREALCEMLHSNTKHRVAGQVADGEQLLELLKSQRPDLIILDLSMPKIDGFAALDRLSVAQNPPPVLVLSANSNPSSVKAALKAGARGYIPKNAAKEEFEFAIDSILKGQTYLSPSVAGDLVGPQAESEHASLEKISAREREVLTLLAEGKPNREISQLLHISPRTVDTHRSNLLRKLNVKTNAQLVKIAIFHGLTRV